MCLNLPFIRPPSLNLGCFCIDTRYILLCAHALNQTEACVVCVAWLHTH